jgi:outer membrane protein OmpA-like peptidoglycan-associated protein
MIKASNETEGKSMSEDWSVNVRKYAPDADPAVIAGIIRHCGIALQSRNASLVSFTDKTETDRVRENFLKKKLALTAPDAELDSAIAAVGEKMKPDRMKNRVTVYYLLADHFGKLALFDKHATTESTASSSSSTKTDDSLAAKAGAAGAAALGAVGLGSSTSDTDDSSDTGIVGKIEGAGTAAIGAAGAGLAAGASAISGSFGGHKSPEGGATSSLGKGTAQAFAGERGLDAPVAKSGLLRWLPWLVLAAALIWLLLYLNGRRHEAIDTPVTTNTPAETASVTPADTAPPASNVTAPAATPAAIPTGAGVTSELRDGKPAVIVYFDTGKAAVASAFAPAAASLKTYLDSNAGSKLTVSGFNDKTGNAAFNAELSKNRAKAVEAALVAANIPVGSIELIKPTDATDTDTTNAAARRVEVVVK